MLILVCLMLLILIFILMLFGMMTEKKRQQQFQQVQAGELEKQLRTSAQEFETLLYKIQQDNVEKVLRQLSEASLLQQRELGELKAANQLSQHQFQKNTQTALFNLKTALETSQHTHRTTFDQRQLESFKLLQDTLQARLTHLANSTDERLKAISGQVDKRLAEGFERTTATFTDVVKRLALIDEAQKRIAELSTNVISLQSILSDKRSRGAFGEVQLTSLVRNMLPEQNISLQHTLSNNKRADCLLLLPQPTGNIVIDAKFPLESYQRMQNHNLAESERIESKKQFKQDIKKHISDITEKYIIPGETSDGAMMFIPAEAIFAEIHAEHPDLVDLSHRSRVWMVSPTTLMAILTTVRAVIKDEAMRKQAHLIQEHLRLLAIDFDRFQERMQKLSSHIKQANQDIDLVSISAEKITNQFRKIEAAEAEDKNYLN